MLALNRKKRANRYKPQGKNSIGGNAALLMRPLRWLLRGAILITAVTLMGLFFIFCHDLLTQCGYFAIETIEVKGLQNLRPEQIKKQCRIDTGTNMLAINLDLARKRLLAHPWIREAAIARELPSKIVISIQEQSALAVIDFGESFLMDRQGDPFKKQAASDETYMQNHLPVISGLGLCDLDRNNKFKGRPHQAVMKILKLGQVRRSILPNRLIEHIHVDKDIGLSLSIKETEDFYSLKTSRLKFDNYSEKYDRLKNLIAYLKTINPKKNERLARLESLDLNHTHRIVARPCKAFIARQG